MRISPIVEYADLECHDTERLNNQYVLWNPGDWAEHLYWGEITNRLMNAYGLYIFYDSVTRPLYVGIAKDQTLWERSNQSYNVFRERQGKIMTVHHPSRNKEYQPDRVRRIKRQGFSLWQVASYFSAYEVDLDSIGGLEAFAIRAFGGGLLNTKMEGNGGFGLSPISDE